MMCMLDERDWRRNSFGSLCGHDARSLCDIFFLRVISQPPRVRARTSYRYVPFCLGGTACCGCLPQHSPTLLTPRVGLEISRGAIRPQWMCSFATSTFACFDLP